MARDKTTAPCATTTGMTNGPAPDPPDHLAVVRRRLWVPALWLWRRNRNRRRSADRPGPLPRARSSLAGLAASKRKVVARLSGASMGDDAGEPWPRVERGSALGLSNARFGERSIAPLASIPVIRVKHDPGFSVKAAVFVCDGAAGKD